MEEMLKPLYNFMAEPSKVCFDDEIVLNIKQFIRRNKSVSATQWMILPTLPKVL
jgi:hypothetical protein